MIWDNETHDEMKWGEWHSIRLLLTFWGFLQRRIVCFGWAWIIQLWQCLDVRNRFCWWLGVPERWSQRVQDFILLIKTACNLKLMNCLSLEFSINIFGPTLTISSWNQGWGWTTVSPVLAINDPKTNNWQVAEPRFVFSVFLFQFQSPLWGYTN